MFKVAIGLEIHVELNTRSKMFCPCLNDPDERHPNVNICPVCMGHPGTLPVINQEAVRKVIKTGLALNCQISGSSKFDRKNYFYPDLPKGYQISQYGAPLCKEGFLEIPKVEETASRMQKYLFKKVRIREVHLEEDTGRLIHFPKEDHSLVDFNRAGVPLMELVTEPDMESTQEVRKFAEELQLILRYLEVSSADMEKGQMRVEANISLSPIPGTLGTKVEIKNLNSFRALEGAVDYEIERQTEILKKGKKIVQETRGWDEVKRKTVSQRTKERAFDYRYFPEPDLPPMRFSEEFLEEVRSEIPELPQPKRERFKKEYHLSEEEIEIFVKNKDFSEFFEKVVSELPPGLSQDDLSRLIKLTSNYLITDLTALLKEAAISGEDFLISAENFAEFVTMIFEGKISSKIAKRVLKEMFAGGGDPSHIVEERGLLQLTDEQEIKKVVEKVISKNQKAVSDFKGGKEETFQFLVGEVIAATKGRANPQMVKKMLEVELKGN